jgi:hypothetical protein
MSSALLATALHLFIFVSILEGLDAARGYKREERRWAREKGREQAKEEGGCCPSQGKLIHLQGFHNLLC